MTLGTVLVLLDGHAVDGYGAACFSDEGSVIAQAGSSPNLLDLEFDPLMNDSDGDAALPRDAHAFTHTSEVIYLHIK